MGRGLLEAVTEYSQVPEMHVIVIAVPTPLTKNLNPDLQYVENVTRDRVGPDTRCAVDHTRSRRNTGTKPAGICVRR